MKLVSKNLSLFTIAALALVDLLGAVPPATATPTPFVPIAFETTQYNTFSDVADMSYLATRSQRKPLVKSGTGPFTMTYTNADPQLAYQYQTDANYGLTVGGDNAGHSACDANTDPTDTRGCLAQLYESDIRLERDNMTRTTPQLSTQSATLVIQGSIFAQPDGFTADNTKDSIVTFGTAFGPQVWSTPFSATAGSALSYTWNAEGDDDDYELYAFLVRVADIGSCDGSQGYGGTTQQQKESSHSILTYSRGRDTGGVLISSTTIQNDGCYRVRFVNGSYDASGGRVIGAAMEIADLLLGSPQTITVDPISDLVRDPSNPQNVQISASSNAVVNGVNPTLEYSSLNPTRCTVNANGAVTVVANALGRCTFRIDSGEVGSFVAANSTYVSFEILAAPTAPRYFGGATITGDAFCTGLSVDEGVWSDGADPINGTTIQWFRNDVAIAGSTSSTITITPSDIGDIFKFSISKSNTIGSSIAFSSSGVVIQDTRLSDLTTSGSTIAFDSCVNTYAITSETNQFVVTATAGQNTTLSVGGVAATSGQATSPITLNSGLNVIRVVSTVGGVSRTTTLNVTWNAPAEPNNNTNPPVISYPEPAVKLVIGSYVVLTPESTGGAVTSWAIDLTLPDGLVFDVDSGVISGTPTTPGGAINFTITGTNADGSATTQLQIEVLAYVRADGPLIEKINPRIIFSDETTQVTVTGKRLQLIDSVTIDGITITITLVSRTLATFEAPELEAGKKNLAFATDGHGMLMAFNGLEVIDRPVLVTESPVVPTPTDSPVVTPTDSPVVVPPVTESPGTGGGDSEPGQRVIKRTVSGFAPGSSELTDALKALIREKYEEVGSPLKVTCIGYTQGPTNLDSDRQLSLDRATVACDYLKTLNPEIEVLRMEGKQEVPVGSSVRRVEMYFVVPINS